MPPDQFETEVLRLLRENFVGPNDPGLAPRRRQLRSLFNSVQDAATAKAYYDKLSVRNDQDTLSKEFYYRISTPTRNELLQILSRNSQRTSAATGGQTSERKFRLVDEEHNNERAISRIDPEFVARYVDSNIVHVTTDPDPHTLEHHTMIVHYKDGRQLQLALKSVPVRHAAHQPGMRVARPRFSMPIADHYVLRKGVVLPVDRDGETTFNDTDTPNLIDFRTTIKLNIILREQRLEIAELTNTFPKLISASADVLSFGMSLASEPTGGISVRPRLGGQKARFVAGKRPDATHVVSKQYKQVGAREMLAWERQGGHTLQKHNSQLTRRTLLQRVVGEAQITTPQIEPKSATSTDFRVWQGKKSAAASGWIDRATMNKAVGDVIHSNIAEIRAAANGGQEWVRERYPVGYKTGHGWVETRGAPKTQCGVFWDDNLQGMTIVIRPRKGHIPTAEDPEVWYVHTAYPDRASKK